MLKVSCVVKGSEFKPNHNLVCFKNGALDMRTYQLVPQDPAMLFRSGRNAVWDENEQGADVRKIP